MTIKENIDEILEDIKKYSPYPERVKLVAVTKYMDTDKIEEVIKLGQNSLGENKAQLIREKINYFKDKNIDVEWHFIGNLQKNKIKYIINDVSLIHSVNKISLAQEIDKKASQINRIVDVLLEVNIHGEESKQGYSFEELLFDLKELKALKNINIKGLMTMAPLNVSSEITRKVFSHLVELKNILNKEHFGGKLTELSMGMSGDYRIALEEGSTIIRIGSNLLK
ncbi:MAG: YggS family pyridoxal phosphate-dependent enzyme [Fusobacterium sp.]|uniref:YggS family pyridoxal phosphate-dependent enzyme n=1 Tax=Fusobacterium sp. TaxID=68766 RepID=UPI0026DBAF7F|nr:YggS family pyridoxal phosphate-dependent enzyme [Fusobacterium sp.]MDO4690331.1 YggS family pyridoxal phosphate-dependent enzyme [Fusobacterium sp.]